MARTTNVRCKNTECKGSVGAWQNGTFLPSPHLVGSRHIWIDAEANVHMECSLCKTEHILKRQYAERMMGKLELH